MQEAKSRGGNIMVLQEVESSAQGGACPASGDFPSGMRKMVGQAPPYWFVFFEVWPGGAMVMAAL